MTHAQWQVRLRRGLAAVSRNPGQGQHMLDTLLARIEAEAGVNVGDWHVDQTLEAISIVQSQADDHQRSAETMRLLASRSQQQLVYYERAFVAACATAALELAAAGDRAGATRALRSARPVARRLRPRERLFRLAEARVAAKAKRRRGLSRAR